MNAHVLFVCMYVCCLWSCIRCHAWPSVLPGRLLRWLVPAPPFSQVLLLSTWYSRQRPKSRSFRHPLSLSSNGSISTPRRSLILASLATQKSSFSPFYLWISFSFKSFFRGSWQCLCLHWKPLESRPRGHRYSMSLQVNSTHTSL